MFCSFLSFLPLPLPFSPSNSRLPEMFLKLKETGDSPWPVFLTPFILAPLIVVPLLTPYIYDDTVHGYCDPQFKPVYNAFR